MSFPTRGLACKWCISFSHSRQRHWLTPAVFFDAPSSISAQIQEVEDRRKIDVLLSLSGTTESSLTYFIKELDEGKLVRQHLPPQLQAFAKELDVRRRLEGKAMCKAIDGRIFICLLLLFWVYLSCLASLNCYP